MWRQNSRRESDSAARARPAAAAGAGSALSDPTPESYTPKHLAEKILTSKAALEGERKQVTVLFADLKGSMELLADRDPEEARKLLDPVLERMMEAVHRYEGTVNQVMGDGIMALFGAPLAHEDHAVRACYAAIDLQRAMRRLTETLRQSHGVTVQARVGLNSGEVVVRAIASDLHMDYTAVGQTTHLAARMEQLASPGTTLLTADTLRLAEGYVEVKPLGADAGQGAARRRSRPTSSRARGPGARGSPRRRRAGLTPLRGPGRGARAASRGARPRGEGHGQVVAHRRRAGRREVAARLGGHPLPPDPRLADPRGGLGLVRQGHAVPPGGRPPPGLLPDRRPGRAPRHPGEGHGQAPHARPRPRAGAAGVPRAARRAGGGPPVGGSGPARSGGSAPSTP